MKFQLLIRRKLVGVAHDAPVDGRRNGIAAGKNLRHIKSLQPSVKRKKPLAPQRNLGERGPDKRRMNMPHLGSGGGEVGPSGGKLRLRHRKLRLQLRHASVHQKSRLPLQTVDALRKTIKIVGQKRLKSPTAASRARLRSRNMR